MSAIISGSLAKSRTPSTTDVRSLEASWRRGLLPTLNLNAVEWAEEYRRLSRESSNGGKMRISRREISRGPLLAATEPGVQTISVMTATQLMKTTIIECIVGRQIHLDPCPILVVAPDDKAADTFSTDRLSPMIRDTPVLRELFSGRSRDSANTLDHKQFPGGHITMVGARSPTNLAARPVRLVVLDEIDKYVASREGDPIILAEERQAEFPTNKLSVRCCSPTIAGHSNIETAYLESDQRKAFVACPHCAEWQTLEWEQVKGPGGGQFEKTPSGRIRWQTAALYCVSCDAPWSEAERLLALRSIEWRQTKHFDCCGIRQAPATWRVVHDVGRAVCVKCGDLAVPNDHAGFMASKLYAPNQTVGETVRKFDSYRRLGPEGLKPFWNTQLARTWKEDGEAAEWQSVYNKRDRYRMATVPRAGLLLFGGVDVQKDRLEVGLWAFGRNRERWLVDHFVIPGPTNRPEVWAELAKVLQRPVMHETGREMLVRDWGIDSGAFTSEVKAFCLSQQGLGNVHPVDGADSYVGAFLGVGNLDTMANGKKVRRGLKTVRVGVSFCKQELVHALALDRPPAGQFYPPGFVHLPDDIPEDGVKQITAEELTQKVEKGRTRRTWNVIAGRRNEWLDCHNYARGLAAMRQWDRMRESHFQEIERSLGIEKSVSIVDDAPVKSDAVPEKISDKAMRVRPRRSVVRRTPMR